MENKRIYLVTPNCDRYEIRYATFDQWRAQQTCHLLKRITGTYHGIVKERWFDLHWTVRCALRENFKEIARYRP